MRLWEIFTEPRASRSPREPGNARQHTQTSLSVCRGSYGQAKASTDRNEMSPPASSAPGVATCATVNRRPPAALSRAIAFGGSRSTARSPLPAQLHHGAGSPLTKGFSRPPRRRCRRCLSLFPPRDRQEPAHPLTGSRKGAGTAVCPAG